MQVKKPSSDEISRTKTWGIWSKEKSEFEWNYDEKETCYILEGTAEVIDEKGNKINFGPGDWVEFSAGLKCTWRILKPIRKRFNFGE